METRACPGCAVENGSTAKFCSQCGTRLECRCAACGTALPPAARFCSECGAPVADAPAAASPPPARPLAPDDGRRVAAREVERRHITFMFCDLVGSTHLSHVLDPEDLRDLLAEYHAICSHVVSRYDGTIAQYHGDGVLVYFGYPMAHEDDARRGVQAALEILRLVRGLDRKLRLDRPISVSLRIGLHTGLAVVGDVGSATRTERLAQGEAPNIAARMQALAEPDTIVISTDTHQLVAGLFHATSLGTHVLKGMPEPMEVYRVLGVSGAPHRLEAAPEHRLTPYVGREALLGHLHEGWAAARGGTGGAVLVCGEPGLGKSRLLRVFRQRIEHEIHDERVCYCSPYYRSTALYPIAGMLARRFGLDTEGDPRGQVEQLASRLAALGREPAETVPLLAPLFGLAPDAGYTPLGLHPLTQKQKTLEALLALLLDASAAGPALLIVEDLHWVDPTTLELLGALLPRLASHRLFAIVTARPEFRPPWPDAQLAVLSLDELSDVEITTMVRRIAQGKPLPSQVLSLLVSKTDGNPLFVEEMTRMVLDSGLLAEREDRFELAGALPDVAVPATLKDLLTARLDQMAPEARKVVQVGATIGREFTYELLREVLPGEDAALGRGLDQLLASGLVYASSDGFSIKHALIQDAAYEALLRRTRQQYHEAIARALESGFGGDAAAHPERLAQHWQRAGRPHKAIPYWLRAGQQSVAGSANHEAVSHLRQGLELIATLPESPDRHHLELEALSTLGTALTVLNGWAAPEVEDAYARAQALTLKVSDSPQLFWVLWGLWAFYLVKGDQQQGYAFAQRMMDVAQAHRPEALALEADFALGLSLYYMGDLAAAQAHLERAVAAYVADDHHPNAYLSCQDVGVTSRSVAAMVRHLRGDVDGALACAHDAVTLAERLRHPFSQAYALGCASWLHAYRREPEAMAAHAAACVTLSQEAALGFWLVWGSILAGRALVDEGRADEGIAQMEQAIGTYRAIGTGMVVPFFLTLLADAYGARGDDDLGLERLREARAMAMQGGETFAVPEIDRLEGDIRWQRAVRHGAAADAADVAAAHHLYECALATSRAQENRIFALRATASLARLLAWRGDVRAARDLLASAVTTGGVPDDTRELAEVRAQLASLEAAPGVQ
jgi:class 3 adenylate cyclase/predicted ATPase